jgi:6-phosphogluconolactonase
MKTYVAESAEAAGVEAAELTARRVRRALATRGRASIALSGGSTPGPMFDALAECGVEWDQVDVFQVDERIAPDGDEQRNANMLTERLLVPARVPARRVHLMPVTAKDLRRASASYARAIEAVAPFDVVHLGMGDDGHTASWPPGDPVIDSDLDVDVSAEYQGVRRMTMTPAVVNAAKARLMLVTEASKAPVMRRWIDGDSGIPASRVRRTNTMVVAISGVVT